MPIWLTDHCYSFWLSGTLALKTERQSTRKSKTETGQLVRLASSPWINVAIFSQTPLVRFVVDLLRNKLRRFGVGVAKIT